LGGVERWNKVIEKAVTPFKLVQPHKGLNPKIGELAGKRISAVAEDFDIECPGHQPARVDVKRTFFYC